MKKRLAALAAAFAAASTQAQVASNTLPTGGAVASGSASISTSGSSMQINQSSDRAILNWQSFSIGSGAQVQFNQPSAASIALNRVTGSNPSQIYGRLTANGQVFLTNPHGVLFAPGASVEVGSLFATTLSITDADFLAGRYVFANSGNAGEVINAGTIVTPNGYAALAGPRVRNDGVIVANLGTVALAAGERVTLDMVGDGLINVSVDQAALNALALNTGSIEANGGRVLLRAASANELLDTVINNTGTLRATRLAEQNGEIVLDAPTGIVRSTTVPETESLTVIAAEAYIGAPFPPPTPVTGGGGLGIPPLLETITFTGSFSISGTLTTQIAQPLGVQSGTITTTPTSSGSILITNNIGMLSPLEHSIVGTGVNVPRDAFLLAPAP